MASTRRVVVTDANVLINLIHVGRLDLLGKLSGYAFAVPEHVFLEVTHPDQAQALQAAVDAGHVSRETMTDPAELALYARHRQIMGRGEAACLAMAEHRGWLVAGDERGAFLRTAHERLGANRLLNTPGLLVLAIRTSVITVEEADQIKAILAQNRFVMKFASFKDVLGGIKP
jgi:predicted nucleic acid-binding protein